MGVRFDKGYSNKYIERVPNELLGMDVDASRGLAATVAGWPSHAEEVRSIVTDAEVLADMPLGVVASLDEIGRDGTAMAAAIRRAVRALESFTIQLDSPLTIALAVASVQAFRGTENDPELDRRLRSLHEMVAVRTASEVQAAQVMSMLLAASHSLHVAGRDLDDVAAAMASVGRLNRAEARGAVSSNDPRIDDATAGLRKALSTHAASELQLDELVAAFLADRNTTDPATLLASVVTGAPVDVVEFAHDNGIDYDIAAGVLDMQEVDRLTAALRTAQVLEAEEINGQRAALFRGLIGVDDAAAIGVLSRLVDVGASARNALAVRHSEQIRAHHIDQVAELFDLNLPEAERQFEELAASTDSLVASGWDLEDAAVATRMAALRDFDLGDIVAFAADEGVSLVDGAVWFSQAHAMAMTPDEYRAFDGLVEHFFEMDTATGGNADGVVSVDDLASVVNNPLADAELVAAAWALIHAPDVRNRLDSATVRGGVVATESFGADVAQDHKISQADIDVFRAKQSVNFLLAEHRDTIDVAAQGRDLSLADGELSEQDFRAVHAHAEELNLSEAEVAAVELVLEHDWYDQTFWQENSDTIILATTVFAGAVLFVASGGLSGGLSGALIASAVATGGGAAAAAGITVAENLVTGDEWAQDLRHNTTLGAIAGLGGAGLAGAAGTTGSVSLAGRVLNLTGAGADLAGLGAAGLFDPLLRQFGDDVEVAAWKADAQRVSYVAGGAAVLGAAAAATGKGLQAAQMQDALPPRNYANFGDDALDDGLRGYASRIPESAPREVGARARADIASLLIEADELSDSWVLGVAQRAAGVGIDGGTALADNTIAEVPPSVGD